MRKYILLILIIFTISFIYGYADNKSIEQMQLLIDGQKRTIAQIKSDLKRLDDEISEKEHIVKKKQAEIDYITEKINNNEADIRKLNFKISRNTFVLQERVRAMYKISGVDYINMLVNSQDIGDFLDNLVIINKIVNFDQKLIDELKKDRNYFNNLKSNEEKIKEKLIIAKQTADNAKFEAEEDKKAADAMQYKAEKELDRLNLQMMILSSEANAMNTRLITLCEVFPFEDKGEPIIWPLYEFKRISSPFGYRIHPILGRRMLHTGMDLSSDGGTPIHAVKDGIVIIAAPSGSYGNLVMINHGGGLVTGYAHASAIYVSVGQEVKQGDIVAAVGSTGRSTGNHLHFEVRINGEPNDPISYLP